MTLDEKAQAAWETYKISMRNHPRRQLRKRDFIAGYASGVLAEMERTMTVVVPANLALYKLTRDIEEDPTLYDRLWEIYPNTMRKLMKVLRGEDPR